MNESYQDALKEAGAKVEAHLKRPMTVQESLIVSLMFIYGMHEGGRRLIEARLAEQIERNKATMHQISEVKR